MSSSFGERSLIGGALSNEFMDCSVAAADLSKKANERIKESSRRQELYVIGEDRPSRFISEPIYYRHEDEHHSYLRSFQVNRLPAPLILLHPLKQREVEETQTKKGFLGRTVKLKAIETQEFYADDPVLGISIGEDTVLPLASFARRPAGDCSYIQLGQEMQDDNFYVTTADDSSSRHDLIEAFRSLLTRTEASHYGTVGGKLSDHEQKLINTFINSQVEIHQAQIDQAIERQLVERAIEAVRNGREQDLLLLQEGTSTALITFLTHNLIPQCSIQPGRSVEITFGAPKNSDLDSVTLLAIAGGGIAIEIASLSKEWQEIKFVDGITESDKQTIVRLLQHRFNSAPPSIESIEVPEKFRIPKADLKDEDRIISSYCRAKGLLSVYEGTSSAELDADADIVIALEKFFASPERAPMPLPSSKPLHLALHRLKAMRAEDVGILSHFNLAKKFDSLCGRPRICDEQLLYAVEKLTGQPAKTVIFKDVQIGKTIGNAEISAQVTKDEGQYQVSISGRPAAMPDEPLKNLLNIHLDPALPLLGHLKEADTIFRPENVSEITDLLLRVRVLSAKQKVFLA